MEERDGEVAGNPDHANEKLEGANAEPAEEAKEGTPTAAPKSERKRTAGEKWERGVASDEKNKQTKKHARTRRVCQKV